MEAVRFIVFLLLLVACFAQECEPSTLEYDCMFSPTDYYTLHWTLEGNDLHVVMEGIGAEWVGFSFTDEAGAMFPADAVIGWTDVNGPVVLPYHITTTSVFAQDEDSAVVLKHVLAEQNRTKTRVYFTRSLIQGRVRVDPEAETDINFAIGDTDFLRYHSDNRGSAKIVLAAIPKGGVRKEFVSPLLRQEKPATEPQVEPIPEATAQEAVTIPATVEETDLTVEGTVEFPAEAPEDATVPDSEERTLLDLEDLK